VSPEPELDEILRVEGGAALATLARILGDLQRAQDAVQDATVRALERWPVDGIPRNPAGWLVTVGRNREVDRLRREARRAEKEGAAMLMREPDDAEPAAATILTDDVLRLVFTCCHPALASEARIALALRTLCGLTTAEIARAFVVTESTMAQRLVRAKHKIATARIPYRVPDDHELPERLPAVLAVVYVVFTAGHAAGGEELVRVDLCDEAIRLARLLAELLPDEAEVEGLLALLLLTDARRAARLDAAGELVLLEDQDRATWDREAIAEGGKRLERALRRSAGSPGPYQIQAAIAAAHSTAPSWAETDWTDVAALYDLLLALAPGPVVALNRAVAIAYRDGPAAGLALVDGIDGLDRYHLWHATRAELLRRLGRAPEAAAAYTAALGCDPSDAERRFLERGRVSLTGPER
jgi:RNA polymerase sigma-70 factor (ECF subfamily)